jgi:membrane-associated phospholipid phosphatase
MEPLQQLGLALTAWLQAASPALDGLMNFFSFLGSIELYLLLIPIIYWLYDPRLGVRVLLVLLTTDFIGNVIKQLFHQPRPYWIGPVQGLAQEISYGIPSTHSSNSLAVWGYLTYRLNKAWLWGLATAVVLLIGLSRLYLGVHFPHDVLFGWLIGLAVIVLFARFEKPLAAWLAQQSLAGQALVGLVASLVVVLVGWLVLALIAGSPDPEPWRSYAAEARSLTHYITLGGALFGTLSGYALMKRHAPFQPAGGWGRKLACYLLGLAGLLVIYLGLDLLFGLLAADESLAGYVLRYLRYASLTLWATFLAPWFFIRLRLAEKRN